MSTEPPADAWPTSEPLLSVPAPDEPTLVAPPPPTPPGPPMAPGGPPLPPDERRVGEGMLLGIVLLALVAFGLFIAWLVTHRHHHSPATTVITTVVTPTTTATTPVVAKVSVPRVVGLKEPAALSALAQAGLRPKEVFRPTKQPKGLVVSQNPEEATSVKRGTQVTLVVDSGAPKVAVPAVVGLSFDAAQAKLDALGLDSAKTDVTSDKPAGTVVDQAPKSGSLAKGSVVTLSVAKAAPVSIPSVVGQDQSQAQSTLEQAGFKVNPVTVHSEKPKGQVTAQNPAASGQALKGSTVRINVSDGAKAQTPTATSTVTTTATSTTATTTTPAQPRTASVPDLSGSTVQQAAQQLNAAGFLVSLAYVPGQDTLDTVVAQAPEAGQTAQVGAHVTVNAANGPNASADTMETVPNVVGQTLTQAVSTLQGAHLRLIYLKRPVTTRAQVGHIVEQTPLSGKKAPQNAQILVYLGVLKQ